MKYANPVENFKPKLFPDGDVTQFFGSNKELYSKNVCYPEPLGCLQGHNGWDIVRPWGTSLFAVEDAKVVEVRSSPDGYGKNIRLLTPAGNEWIYAHLSSIDCALGQQVKAGDLVAKMGNTGFVVSGSTPFWSTNPYAGTHLHLGLRKIKLWDGSGTWNVTYATGEKGTIENYYNGFFGAVPFDAADFPGYVPLPKPKYTFKRDLEYGMKGDPDVAKLQDCLRYLGYFPETQASTGNYFEVTRQAVLAFQKAYKLITPFQEFTYRGNYCYQLTRAQLNSIFG